jgi:hypothetical protein
VTDALPTETQWALEAKNQLAYYLSQCGFGFLEVEIHNINLDTITLKVSDGPSYLRLTVPIYIKQMESRQNLFGELALSVLRRRENVLRLMDEKKSKEERG